MRTVVAIICVAVAFLCLFIVVRQNEQAGDVKKFLDAEKYKRLVAEEQIEGNEAVIKRLKSDLASAKATIAKVQKVLEDERDLNLQLQTQMRKVAASKRALEKELKNALVESELKASSLELSIENSDVISEVK